MKTQAQKEVEWDFARLKGSAQQIVHLAEKYKEPRIGVEIAKLAAKLEKSIKTQVKLGQLPEQGKMIIS